MPTTYANRLLMESDMQRLDEGLPHDGPCLATICRRPAVVAAINKARESISRERLRDLYHGAGRMLNPVEPTEEERVLIRAVWRAMPGESCFVDALTITARL